MLKIERTQQFKRDYRRESKGRHRLTLEALSDADAGKVVQHEKIKNWVNSLPQNNL